MTFNKIPLALGFNSSTGNASGLVEFTLDLSNVGDVCEATPTEGQTLVFSGDAWCPSTIVTGGGGGGGSVSLGYTAATGTGLVTNSGGSDATIPAADGTNAGLILASEKATVGHITVTQAVDLDAIETIANNAARKDQANTFTEANSFGVTTTNIDTNGILKLSNVEQNSLMITDSASAVSSLSGASGTVPYFEGTNPAPALQPITTILQNAAVRVEDKDLGDLANVAISNPGSIESGTPLVSRGGDSWGPQGGSEGLISFGEKSVSAVSGSYTVSNVVTVPPGFTGRGDTTVDSFIMFSGTDASSTEYVGTRWGANWVEGPQNIATTDGNYFAYVSATPADDGGAGSSGVAAVALNANALQFMGDGKAPAPMTVLAIGSGTADVDGVEHDMHWKVPAISDSNITFAATEGSSITFAVAGTYQIDVAARLNGGSSSYNRLQGTLMTYKYNTGTSSWDKLTDHIADDYVTRDATTGPIGSFNLNTMLELSANDKLKFSVSADSLGSSANMMEAGTILRIVGWH